MTEEPLRVAVWHNLPSGGGKRALHSHVRGLAERGHHVEVWCPPTADRAFLPLAALVEEHVLPLDIAKPPLPLRVLRRAGLYSFVERRLRAMDAHSRAVAGAIGNDFDVLFANSCQLHTVTSLAQHVAVPSVLYLQEPNRALYEALPALPWLRRSPVARGAARRQARAELEGITAYDRVLVNSYFSRESILRAYGVEAAVCYLGVDTDLFVPASGPARDYVVGVGAFVAAKNIELVIEALAAVKPGPPPLVWTGDHATSDSYVAHLERLASDLAVPFTVLRRVGDEELVALIGGARLMVYCPRLEPFGLAPLEANACGVPVVAGAEGGVREAIADGVNGLLIEPHADALTAAIERLWSGPREAEELGTAGRANVLSSWREADAVARLEAHLASVSRSRSYW